MICLLTLIIRLRWANSGYEADPLANVVPQSFTNQQVGVPEFLRGLRNSSASTPQKFATDGTIRNTEDVVLGHYTADAIDLNSDGLTEAFVKFDLDGSPGFFVEQFFPAWSFVPAGELTEASVTNGGVLEIQQECWELSSDESTGRIFGRTITSCPV